MKVAVRYYSRTGNTKKLAEAIAEAVGVDAREVSEPLEEKTDIVFLGSAVYAAGVDASVRDFIGRNRERIVEIYNFSTAALLKSTYKQVRKIAESCGVKMSEKEFACRGSFAMMHKGHPDAEDLKRAAEFARSVTG